MVTNSWRLWEVIRRSIKFRKNAIRKIHVSTQINESRSNISMVLSYRSLRTNGPWRYKISIYFHIEKSIPRRRIPKRNRLQTNQLRQKQLSYLSFRITSPKKQTRQRCLACPWSCPPIKRSRSKIHPMFHEFAIT